MDFDYKYTQQPLSGLRSQLMRWIYHFRPKETRSVTIYLI